MISDPPDLTGLAFAELQCAERCVPALPSGPRGEIGRTPQELARAVSSRNHTGAKVSTVHNRGNAAHLLQLRVDHQHAGLTPDIVRSHGDVTPDLVVKEPLALYTSG